VHQAEGSDGVRSQERRGRDAAAVAAAAAAAPAAAAAGAAVGVAGVGGSGHGDGAEAKHEAKAARAEPERLARAEHLSMRKPSDRHASRQIGRYADYRKADTQADIVLAEGMPMARLQEWTKL